MLTHANTAYYMERCCTRQDSVVRHGATPALDHSSNNATPVRLRPTESPPELNRIVIEGNGACLPLCQTLATIVLAGIFAQILVEYRWISQLYKIDNIGTVNALDNDCCSVATTSLEKFLRRNDAVEGHGNIRMAGEKGHTE